jgi:hypothetical protein
MSRPVLLVRRTFTKRPEFCTCKLAARLTIAASSCVDSRTSAKEGRGFALASDICFPATGDFPDVSAHNAGVGIMPMLVAWPADRSDTQRDLPTRSDTQRE